MASPAPSLRRQLVSWLFPVVVGTMLMGLLAVYKIASDATAESLDQGLADAADTYVRLVREGKGPLPVELPSPAQRVLLVMPEDRVFFALHDRNGQLLAGDAGLPADLAWGSLDQPHFFDLQYSGYWLRGISVVFDGRGQAVHLILATTALKRERLADEILLGTLAPQLVIFLLVSALVWAAVRRAMEPLDALRAEIARRSHADLSPLTVERMPEELQPILDEVNELFDRLGQALQVQRHFVADAAHQLRTPVAGLLAQIESADPEHRNEALAATARRLSRLVAQLLALARAEPGALPEAERFDLARLIRDTAGEWLPGAFRQDVDVQFDLQPAPLRGSPHAFRETIANLVDNALRYGRRAGTTGGRLSIHCRREGDEVVLCVDDDGPGIPVEERERVFERFHRLPGTQADGCGLGLPIVRGFAHQHGGEVRLGTAPGLGGLRVEMRVPAD